MVTWRGQAPFGLGHESEDKVNHNLDQIFLGSPKDKHLEKI